MNVRCEGTIVLYHRNFIRGDTVGVFHTENSLDLIVNGRDSYYDFDDYYDRKVQKVIIEFPNDEELQIIKLYIK